jgi:hypothetical protein
MDTLQIGTVTLLRDRVYGEVSVPAGTYPIIKNNNIIYFQMVGYPIIPASSFERHGDGLFSWSDEDRLSGTKLVDVKSKSWTWEDFIKLLQDPLCLPGEEQRLEINLHEKKLKETILL